MDPQEFEARVENIKLRAHGQWTQVLKALGVGEDVLNRKNQTNLQLKQSPLLARQG